MSRVVCFVVLCCCALLVGRLMFGVVVRLLFINCGRLLMLVDVRCCWLFVCCRLLCVVVWCLRRVACCLLIVVCLVVCFACWLMMRVVRCLLLVGVC